MKPFELLGWAAWAPGLESAEDWNTWQGEPDRLGRDGAPAIKFVPALMRRRCDAVSRMMLYVIEKSCPESVRSEVASVFSSRHGSFDTRIDMLEKLAVDEPLSPANFSHSVHNAQSGIFSIWAGNKKASTSLAGAEDSFGLGLLEAMAIAEAGPDPLVLYVASDHAIRPERSPLGEQDHGNHALAMLIARPGWQEEIGAALRFGEADPEGDAGCRGDEIPTLTFALEPTAERSSTSLPDALSVALWLRSEGLRSEGLRAEASRPEAESLRIDHGRRAWVLSRSRD